jgi:hypothetical protein
MTLRPRRPPTRSALARSPRELSVLWAKPPDPSEEKAAAPGRAQAAFKIIRFTFTTTPAHAKRKGTA